MGRIKQSVVWWPFAHRNLDPVRFIKTAAEVGYAAMELLPRRYWSLVRENGMKIAAIIGHGTPSDGLNHKENHTRIEGELLENIELAAQHGIPNLICFSGNRKGLSDEEGLENTAERLARIAKVAERKGITLCLELLNSKVDHPDYQCDRTWWGIEVCKRVDSPAVKLLYDIYHMQVMEGDLIRTIRENIQYIAHFHTAGNPGRQDLDDEQEIYYPAVMQAIAETGYTGYVGHEFIPKGDPYEAIRAAFQTCDR